MSKDDLHIVEQLAGEEDVINMLLYFTNDSKQKKILIETDYIEDIYDEMQAFFEDFKIRPHFIKLDNGDNTCIIRWNSQSEMFVCEDIVNEQVEELKDLLEGAKDV